MNSQSSILLRTLAWEFYRRNAGFFAVLLIVCFVFMRAVEHYMLMMAALHSVYVLGAMMFLWIIYWLKTVHFTWQALGEKQNHFVQQLYLYPPASQYRLLGLLHLGQFSPVMLYAGIMAGLGLFHGRYVSTFFILLVLLVILTLTISLYHFLFRPGRQLPALPVWLQQPVQQLQKPGWSLPLFYLLHQQKLALLLSKICSCLLLLLVAYLYTQTQYDSRLAGMAICLAALGNAVLVFQIHTFDNISMYLQRNMPVPLYQRFLNTGGVLLLLSIPEIAIFSRHFYPLFDISFLLQAVFLLISILLLMNSYLLSRSFQKEKFLLHTLYFLLGYYLINAYGFPLWLVALAGLVAAYLLYRHYYYRFEPEASSEI